MDRMDHAHPRWEEFLERLEGPEGCNFHEDENGEIRWRCRGGMDKSVATYLLMKMNDEGADVNISDSLEFFEQHGGHCDCEILFNVKHHYAIANH